MAISKSDRPTLSFNHRHYVPCLRWKQGEYQALFRLTEAAKSRISPLVEVAEIGFDFETGKEAKSIDEHLSKLGQRVKAKWGDGCCFVDLKLLNHSVKMADGTHPLDFVFQDLNSKKCSVVPVTGIDRDQAYQAAVKRVARRDQLGNCLRVTIEQTAQPNIAAEIARILSFLESRKEGIDFILDLGAPNYSPMAGFQKLLVSIIQRIPQLSQWRTFTIMGTSFPPSMAEVTGNEGILSRNEWILYRGLTNELEAMGIRLPTFGDYAVNHPDVLVADMRIIKPVATIRYAIDDAWWILKGSNVRDNGFAQYRDMCSRLIRSPRYMGPTFSEGDRYIRDCARGKESTGNLTTWRWVGTNHHVHKVVSDVANLFGPSNKT